MHLLIVDDEELTRQGILGSIDFAGLGIDRVTGARDGAEGVRLAEADPVDLVLSDIRMPKMDGLAMVQTLRETSPDLVAIFMSGYTDREYLKTALRLGAVNYIDKPIDIDELTSTLKKAVDQVRANRLRHDSRRRSLEQVSETLAFLLTAHYEQDADRITELWSDYCTYYGDDKFRYVSSIVVKFEDVSGIIRELPTIRQKLKQILARDHLHVISSEKHLYYVVYHIYSGQDFRPRRIDPAISFLREAFLPFGNYYIAVGTIEHGIRRVYDSFQSAIVLLQRAFFCPPGSVLTREDRLVRETGSQTDPEDIGLLLKTALSNGQEKESLRCSDRLFDRCQADCGLLPSRVKSLYIDLVREIEQVRHRQGIAKSGLIPVESVPDRLHSCFCLEDLHRMLVEEIRSYFKDRSSQAPENQTIYLIKSYISLHYGRASLSVKEIADYANLSLSYLCTFFKSETGQTLNGYLTDFRMERAKQLLADPRNRISDISGMVGYNDGNYFSKSFRKSTGLSPTEFREKLSK